MRELAGLRGGRFAIVDAVTFALLQRYRPAAVVRLRIIGETASTPTPPFVFARATGTAQLAALQAGLAASFAGPPHASTRDALFLDGSTALTNAPTVS